MKEGVSVEQHKKMLETALLAGQIMTESNAESYRVEDTMNRILVSSHATYAVAVSFSTSLYASLDDPTFTSGSFTGIKRINHKVANLNKISRVNMISRQLTANKISVEEAHMALKAIKNQEPQYQKWQRSLSIFGLAVSFCVLFGGGMDELAASIINGMILAGLIRLTDYYYIQSGMANVIQAFIVTVGAHVLMRYLFPFLDTDVVIVSTLMPMVPGTAITNSFRDIFREDYLAGGARAVEAFMEALMIAIGAAIGLALIRGIF